MTKIKDENEAGEGLTIDGGGGQRCLGDAGLHHDLEPMLLGEPLVPLLAGLGHPLAEGLADLRVDDVQMYCLGILRISLSTGRQSTTTL